MELNIKNKKGDKVFIKTLTDYYTGEVVDCNKNYITLRKCAWIPSTGRFNKAMRGDGFDEVEPFPEDTYVMVGHKNIVIIIDWKYDLPKEVK